MSKMKLFEIRKMFDGSFGDYGTFVCYCYATDREDAMKKLYDYKNDENILKYPQMYLTNEVDKIPDPPIIINRHELGMTKIKELISRVWTKPDSDEHVYDIYVWEIEDLMKEYAEYYAKRCLQKAATAARIKKNSFSDGHSFDYAVDVNSITKIKLPDHE